MINLDAASVRVVGVRSDVCLFFGLPAGQLFTLETDTIYFAGDYVFVQRGGDRLFAIAGRDYFRTTEGDLPRDRCRVLARAVALPPPRGVSKHAEEEEAE